MHLTSLAEAGLELVSEWHPLKFELLRKASGSSPVNTGINLQSVCSSPMQRRIHTLDNLVLERPVCHPAVLLVVHILGQIKAI